MSEIADLIEKMYGHHYTPQTMSNMTKVLTEEVNAFKSRALNDKYVAIFMDATYIPLKTSNRIQRSDLYCHWYTRRRH
uniref:IS256 family transposase n=1 Tax=Enterococcus faecium TaxID=1352 RepID=A0A455TVR0_ENTFC|nr:IS256 family transposase [Enterococcus faecium]